MPTPACVRGGVNGVTVVVASKRWLLRGAMVSCFRAWRRAVRYWRGCVLCRGILKRRMKVEEEEAGERKEKGRRLPPYMHCLTYRRRKGCLAFYCLPLLFCTIQSHTIPSNFPAFLYCGQAGVTVACLPNPVAWAFPGNSTASGGLPCRRVALHYLECCPAVSDDNSAWHPCLCEVVMVPLPPCLWRKAFLPPTCLFPPASTVRC